jgi:hypothetical protein
MRKVRTIFWRWGDVVFLVLSVGITIASAYWAWVGPSSYSTPMVQIQAVSGQFLYPLNVDRRLSVEGPAGTTILQIQAGKVYAVSSPGPLGIMVQMGKINQSGQWIASLPNRVFVRILGTGGLDGSLY